MIAAPAHRKKRVMVTNQTYFFAFMVSHSNCSLCCVFDLCTQCLDVAASFYTEGWAEFPSILLVAFANDVPIPVRDVDDEIPASLRHALAAKPAIGREPRREGKFFFL